MTATPIDLGNATTQPCPVLDQPAEAGEGHPGHGRADQAGRPAGQVERQQVDAQRHRPELTADDEVVDVEHRLGDERAEREGRTEADQLRRQQSVERRADRERGVPHHLRPDGHGADDPADHDAPRTGTGEGERDRDRCPDEEPGELGQDEAVVAKGPHEHGLVRCRGPVDQQDDGHHPHEVGGVGAAEGAAERPGAQAGDQEGDRAEEHREGGRRPGRLPDLALPADHGGDHAEVVDHDQEADGGERDRVGAELLLGEEAGEHDPDGEAAHPPQHLGERAPAQGSADLVAERWLAVRDRLHLGVVHDRPTRSRTASLASPPMCRQCGRM